MFKGIYQTINMALPLIAFYSIYFMLIAYYARQHQSLRWHLDYTIVSIFMAIVLCVQPIFLPILGMYVAAEWGKFVQLCGIALVWGSLLLLFYARLHLGRYYSEETLIQPGHQVVISGPYAFVRHPLYVSYMIFSLGFLLVTPSISTLAVLAYVWHHFSRAAESEEKLLSMKVPGYLAYTNSTPRFIPRIWILKKEKGYSI